MVVAEVPLWVVHAGGGSSSVESGTNKNHGVRIARAQESLCLLENISGGSKRCAIYAIDMHRDGSKFATGGGDGTVRIWSSTALFAKYRGSFVSGGNYESSDSSAAAEELEGEDDSTKQSEQQETTNDTTENNSLAADGGNEEENFEINDLNQSVRRKNGSQVIASKSMPDSASAKSMASSTQRQKRDASSKHRLLCTLSAHTGSSVMAVRFSASGRYLASAGDDAVVCVYAPSSSGGNLSDNVEHWQRVKLCRGHTLDVTGLAWAPDDSHLVSCSFDSESPIIVWKLTDLGSKERRTHANVLCNPYKILGKDVHTSTVKGVTFDPAGSYIASSGDDPAVCIWRAHDDWGLEKRIDADSGIFRKWKEEDVKELSGQTLFRRLSWSTDGAYICSTNSSIKNKHVASTISREGWSVSGSKSTTSEAANLVGHKHPVVVSRHCPNLLNTRKTEENGNEDHDDEPDYATLIALGDKRGFVTVWSTRKSRPLFKLQCSETRSTVTDLTWGSIGNKMILLVSLLDGHVVSLSFSIPNEIGRLLSDTDHKRVFQLRYGLDFDTDNGFRRGGMFVGDNKNPRLIENALQFTLEEEEEQQESTAGFDGEEEENDDDDDPKLITLLSPSKLKASQQESSKKGKKRIRPVLIAEESARSRPKQNGDVGSGKKERKKTDVMKDALDSAAKAVSAVNDVVTPKNSSRKATPTDQSRDVHQHSSSSHQHGRNQFSTVLSNSIHFPKLPYSTERIHSHDLPLLPGTTKSDSLPSDKKSRMVVDCTNANRVPHGSSGNPMPCVTVSISDNGKKTWRDEIVGTLCTTIAVSQTILAIGTADGCLYLFGTSSEMGWSSGVAFRSHTPIIFGHGIVSLQMLESKRITTAVPEQSVDIVVVSADGAFGVYRIFPSLKLKYKGTILSAMTHMVFGASSPGNESPQPKLARIQLTEGGYLLMILSISSSRSESGHKSSSHAPQAISPGGSLQAFIYDRDMELWMRVSDSRFVLSDLYTTLPSNQGRPRGALAKIDDSIRVGAAASSIRPSRRGKTSTETNTSSLYSEQDTGSCVTQPHCEDRMACSLALASPEEFKYWFRQYVKHLTISGNEPHLRLIVDMLLISKETALFSGSSLCWWLSSAPSILTLDRKKLVREVIIPEMSKNRALQRLMNEVSLCVETS
mmetsp:Transcript_13531/g.15045  ORF Transcript_13531/g.15045 Transcript_13531/m.15045 type:complete len:1161 (-) Transcript_13531:724-4206(-)|eukprot:CAMPEP_0194132294 /NCGR_PEP_ID=MMETSP0152-20130528/2796_1 /TAXON_ID=1049557 /ORGANISM="Thalassiothrix antarctica, Strain L6-D1" /LENGTH=1160 /DNA_ID=CAMNT_0038827301 /DNA_START=196 /DNA_END=3678 /DNA_ORIENTATION=-